MTNKFISGIYREDLLIKRSSSLLKKTFADNLLTPMSSKMATSFFF